MKRILIAICNWIMLLTVPVWAGVVIWYFIAKDYFNKEKPYFKRRYDRTFTGQQWFWGDL